VAGIRIDLSPSEALSGFRDIVKMMLELVDEITPELYAMLEKKAQEVGVHPADFEAIAAELPISKAQERGLHSADFEIIAAEKIPKAVVRLQEPHSPSCKNAISEPYIDPGLNLTASTPNATEQFDLAQKYFFGQGIAADYYKAAKWYLMAAESGHAHAQYWLGYIYSTGLGLGPDDEKAFKCYQKAAEQGDVTAQYKLGDMYRCDDGVDTDETGADWWLEKAPQIAFQWYQKAAEQGHIPSQYYLGHMYEKGEGVAADKKQAIECYRRADACVLGGPGIEDVLNGAESGDQMMQCMLGLFYRRGIGLEQDCNKAIAWLKKAAAQGYCEAQFELGRIYRSGERGVSASVEEAGEWYEKAAAQQMFDAMYNRGRLSEFGVAVSIHLGAEADYKKTIEWYEKAAAHGSKLAQKRLKILKSKIEGRKE